MVDTVLIIIYYIDYLGGTVSEGHWHEVVWVILSLSQGQKQNKGKCIPLTPGAPPSAMDTDRGIWDSETSGRMGSLRLS